MKDKEPNEDFDLDEEEVSGLLDTKASNSSTASNKDEESNEQEAIPLCGILSIKFYR